MEECIFCKILNGDFGTEFVYENDYVAAFNDINPKAPVHVLVVPKVHIASLNELEDKNLMGELEKILRVINRELPDSDKEVLLVVDATTGQNAVAQARDFKEVVGVTGVVLTKLDGTAKGGVTIGVKNITGVPVKLIGVGEKIDDLQYFDPRDFAKALIGE